MRPENADRRGPRQKSVVVVVNSGVVLIVVNAELRCVARLEEILHVQIRDDHLLVPWLECVESAVRIFFEEVEIREVVFPAV